MTGSNEAFQTRKDSYLLKVFVYGTLKPGEVNYQRYCTGKVIQAQSAIAPGQLFDLPAGYPAMTQGLGWVQGFVLSFEGSGMLAQLDDLEDYDVGRPASQNLYERHYIKIFNPAGHSLGAAWVYLMSLERIRGMAGTRLPKGCW